MRIRALAAASLLAVTLAPAGGHADPPQSSPNVDLVSSIPTGVGVGGTFVGNHYFQTVARAGAYVVAGGANTGGLVVLDATRPETPVPVSFLPLPHWQNEDVDVSVRRKLLLLSNQPMSAQGNRRLDGTLYLVDISTPAAPRIAGTLALPGVIGTTAEGRPLGGPGHTATCVLDCRYAYIAGSRDGSVWLADLRDLAAPRLVGRVATPAGRASESYSPGVVHDVHVDSRGNVWMLGSGGTAMYAPLRDPRRPRLLASVSAGDNARLNQLLHHGALRVKRDVVYVTEEALSARNCGSDEDDDETPQDGSFQTWRIDTSRRTLVPLDTFDLPRSTSYGNACSSHWFDVNRHDVVADAWYGQGVRFLDVSNPRRIREIGWITTPLTSAGQAKFVPGRPDLVYVSDYARGLDVVRIANGGRGAASVSRAPGTDPLARPAGLEFTPDDDFGWACRVPVL